MQSPYQAFPLHRYTFQGVASAETLDGRPNYLLHTIEITDITIVFFDTTSITFSGVAAGVDVVLPADTDTVTTTGSVWIS